MCPCFTELDVVIEGVFVSIGINVHETGYIIGDTREVVEECLYCEVVELIDGSGHAFHVCRGIVLLSSTC